MIIANYNERAANEVQVRMWLQSRCMSGRTVGQIMICGAISARHNGILIRISGYELSVGSSNFQTCWILTDAMHLLRQAQSEL